MQTSINAEVAVDQTQPILQQLNDLQYQLKQKEGLIESFNQQGINQYLNVRRAQFEKEDLEFQRNVLKEECEQLVRLNDDLRDLIEEKTRELEKREKEHSIDLENFKKLCDEMVRNISEEKNRALNKLMLELQEKGIEYQVQHKRVAGVEIGVVEPNTAATGFTENQDQESKHHKESSLSGNI